MKYFISLITFLNLFGLNLFACDKEKIFKLYYKGNYEKLFRELDNEYENCKDDCTFIKYYVFFLSSSIDDRFEKIRDFDFSKYKECFDEKSRAKKIYELRIKKGNWNFSKEKCNYFDEIDTFLYCKGSKELLNFVIKEREGKFLGSFLAAYYLFINGYENEAISMAKIIYNHNLQTHKNEEEAFFNAGVLDTILQDLIIYKILNKTPSAKQREVIDKAFKYFPFYFKIYFNEKPF